MKQDVPHGLEKPTAAPQPEPVCIGHVPLPALAQLPRRIVHHELSAAERRCVCGHIRVEIGVDTSEQLDWQPASVFVWQHVIHKYACWNNCGQAGATITAAPLATAATNEAAAMTHELETGITPTPSAGNEANAATPAVVSAVKPAMPIAKGLPGPG